MRDYTEISKWLRNCADINGGCTTCPMIGKTCCVMTLQGNAADAIEELLAERTAFWVDTQPHMDDSDYKKDGMSYYCSNCHHRAGKYKHRSYKFCPWCGAKIVPKEMAVRNED